MGRPLTRVNTLIKLMMGIRSPAVNHLVTMMGRSAHPRVNHLIDYDGDPPAQNHLIDHDGWIRPPAGMRREPGPKMIFISEHKIICNEYNHTKCSSDMDGWRWPIDGHRGRDWDDYAVKRFRTYRKDADQEGDDLQALECELEDAMCNGDMDHDDAEAAIAQLMSRALVNRVHSKPIRKKWVPLLSLEKWRGHRAQLQACRGYVEEAEGRGWQEQPVRRLKPQARPAARKISGPAPRKQFKTTVRFTKTIPDAKTTTFELPEGATIIKREDRTCKRPQSQGHRR